MKMRIPILVLWNECKENVFKQYPKRSIEKRAEMMAWLGNHVYEELKKKVSK